MEAVGEPGDRAGSRLHHPAGQELCCSTRGACGWNRETSTLPTAIDTFFRSLAEDRQEKAVAVVLSGGGSDGAMGIREIKARGGLVLVQDPATAEHGDMPQSAIATEMVDFVLPPGEMPEFLLRYAKQPYVAADSAAPAPATWTADFLQEVLTLVDQRIGHDFRSYKESTLRRRIWRRMSLRQTQQPMEYVQVLRDNPAELDALARDLVISVTYFFRDPDAWQIVAEASAAGVGCRAAAGHAAASVGSRLFHRRGSLFAGHPPLGADRGPGLRTARFRSLPPTSTNMPWKRPAPASIPRPSPPTCRPSGCGGSSSRKGRNYRVSKKVRECVVFADAQRRQRSGLLPLGPD